MEYFLLCIVIFIALIGAFIIACIEDKKREKQFIKMLKKDFGGISAKNYPQGRLDTLKGYCKKRDYDFYIDDITWSDLGLDDVFKRLDYTYSAAGEEYLYSMLRCPKLSEEELNRMEPFVEYFSKNEAERVRLQVLFAKIGRTGKYSIFDYLDNLNRLPQRSNLKHYLGILGIIVGAILCFVNVNFGILTLFIVLAINILTYFKEKGEITPYITSFAYLLRLLNSGKAFEKINCSILDEHVSEMKKCVNTCKDFSRNSYLVTSMNAASSNPLEFVLDYIKMCFHIDLIKFNWMLKSARNHMDDFAYMFQLSGEIESFISIANYRASLDEYTVPKFVVGSGILAKDMYHPLIKEPVKNSFSQSKSMLLTGSNASGKSTFLKMVAINSILAQSIHTVLAKDYQSDFYATYSSMSLRDDVLKGDSYFIVEIKAIKRILEGIELAKQEGYKIMCFVDEVLRGTNTLERISASRQILLSLQGVNSVCFAATHDIELTTLLKEYDNYHFEETIEGDDISFAYRLHKGPATTRNAIKLLKIMGYDDKIVERANESVNHFMENGIWN